MELAIAGQPDQLFHRELGGVFSNVTARANIQGRDIGLGVSWWDYNADGWPDIYVANDHKTPDRLWRNNRDGTFTDVAATALPCVPLASMGTDVADVNNDGYLDLLATEMAGSTHARRMVIHENFEKNEWFFASANPRQFPRNALYLGTGGGQVFEFKIDTDFLGSASISTPEPSTFGMAGLALAFLAARRHLTKNS